MDRMGQPNMDDAASSMRSGMDEAASSVRSKMDDIASSARAKVDDFVSGMKDQARNLKTKSFEDLVDGTVSYVKENPGKAILVSVAVGVALGAYLRSGSRD